MEAIFAIETMQEPRSSSEETDNPSILKNYFSSRTNPSIFISIAPVLLDQSNETSWVFPKLKSASLFLPLFKVSSRSDSSSVWGLLQNSHKNRGILINKIDITEYLSKLLLAPKWGLLILVWAQTLLHFVFRVAIDIFKDYQSL